MMPDIGLFGKSKAMHNMNACLLPRGFAPEKNVQVGRNDWDRDDTSGVANLQPFSSAPLLEYA